MQVVVDSLLVSYEVRGTGKLLVLLHGWGDSAKGFQNLQAALAKKYKVLAVDLPGFGGTEAPISVWGLDEYAQFVAHFLDKVGEKKPLAIIGHSNGGGIAVRGLAKEWLHTDKLVLLASAGIRGTQKGRIGAIKVMTKIGKTLTMPLPKSMKRRLRQKVYAAVGSDMLVAEHLQETFKRVVSDDVRDDAARLTVPTLLLYGEQDQDAPVWYGEAFHQAIDGSTLEVLSGGHFIHLEQPERVVRAIEGFLE
jgi:pimeloyl-ACP methyl ester carboxylesterase